jgi:hypothetical protein
VTLRARARAALTALTLRNSILTERFADQVNIARATVGGRRATRLFVKGDGAKRLH